jgi:hypothetical protein
MILNLIEADVFGPTRLFLVNESNINGITEINLNDKKLDINNEADIKFAIDFINDCKVDTNNTEYANCKVLFGVGLDAIIGSLNESADSILNELHILLNKCNKSTECCCNQKEKMQNIARHFMDEVIDPNGKMPSDEYNKLLTLFTMYGEWVMRR